MSRPKKCKDCTEPCTFHHTLIINDTIQSLDMCDNCPEKDKYTTATIEDTIDNVLAIVGKTLEPIDSIKKKQPKKQRRKKEDILICKGCGASLKEIKKTGSLGCEKCYDVFGPEVLQVIHKLHRAKGHTGKVPTKINEVENSTKAPEATREKDISDLRSKISKLKEELASVIKKEHFERAAEIRDELIKLEAEC